MHTGHWIFTNSTYTFNQPLVQKPDYWLSWKFFMLVTNYPSHCCLYQRQPHSDLEQHIIGFCVLYRSVIIQYVSCWLVSCAGHICETHLYCWNVACSFALLYVYFCMMILFHSFRRQEHLASPYYHYFE